MANSLADEVTRAIEQAKRTPGWNNRRDVVQRFELANDGGRGPCVLIVVPCRRWANHRWQKQARAA